MLGQKQEVLHVARDVARLAVDDDLVAASARQRVRDRPVRIEFVAALVQSHNFEIGAVADGAAVGEDLAGEQLDQCRLAGSVRADDTEAVAAHDAEIEIGDDLNTVVALGDAGCFDDELAR